MTVWMRSHRLVTSVLAAGVLGALLWAGWPKVVSRGYELSGIILLAQQRPAEASAAFTKAAEADPSLAAAYLNRGSIMYEFGNYDHAIRDFTRAIALDSGNYLGFYLRARTHRLLRNYGAAVEDLTDAINRAPGPAYELYFLRAIIYWRLGFHDETLGDFTRSMESAPNEWLARDPTAYRGLARALMGQYEEAAADIRRALEMAPGTPWKFREGTPGEVWKKYGRSPMTTQDVSNVLVAAGSGPNAEIARRALLWMIPVGRAEHLFP